MSQMQSRPQPAAPDHPLLKVVADAIREHSNDPDARRNATILAGKIVCLIFDIWKTEAYKDGMAEVRRLYVGSGPHSWIADRIDREVASLAIEGHLDSIQSAVENEIWRRLLAEGEAST